MREMISTMATLCFKANRKMEPSSPTMPVAAVATARDWGEIIFPTTQGGDQFLRGHDWLP